MSERLHWRARRRLLSGIVDTVRASIKPPPRLNLVEWADEYRYLPDNSAEAGRWRTDRVEAARAPMLSITEKGVQEVTVMSCIQLMKALWIDTPIPTPKGWSTMGSLKVGDTIFGADGKPCKVLCKSDIKYSNKCFLVEFSDGTSVIADAGHKWQVDDSKNRSSTQCTRVANTLEISATFKNDIGGGRKSNRYAIVVAGKLQMPKASLPIEPYTFGVWLGDGHSYSARFTCHKDDTQIPKEIELDGYIVEPKKASTGKTSEWIIKTKTPDDECPYGHKLEVGVRCRTCSSLRSNPRKESPKYADRKNKKFHQLLTELGVLKNKHIPDIYLRSSVEQRVSLLQGLMDTDGTISKDGSPSFTTASKAFGLQVVELMRSLGLKPVMRAVAKAYQITFMAYSNEPVFRLDRKKNKLKNLSEKTRASETFRRRIVNVTEIDSVPVQCIAVDAPDHLYLCGEGMIPTHNTELMINTALYYIHQEPSPIMYIAPKKETAEAWSKERFMKSINTTPVTKEIFSNNRRGEGNTILQKQFAGGQISIVSARNPTDLAMRACRIMLFDEVDKYPINAGSGDGGEGGEGDPISIAWGRATTYGKRAKKIVACSPTVEGRSRVHQEYLASDQREFYQPCPHCNHAEPLDWFKHVIIPENSVTKELDASRAAIVCVNCGTEWTEGDRLKSIRNGYWVAKRPDITHHHGYKVSSLASPFTPIRMLAQEYAKAIGNPQALKAFVNTRLADVYQEKGEVPDWERLYERREAYAHGTVPDGGLLIVAGIDVQKDYLIYEVVAYGRKKRSWSIDIGTIDGHISEDRTKEELSKFLETRYLNSQGNYVGIELALIDSSNDTQEVYSTVYKINTPRLRAIKGVSSLTTIVGNPKPVQININGIRKDGGVKMYPLGVSVIKEQFYKWLMLSRPTDEAIAEGATYPTGYCHFPEWGEDYFKQITAEILVDKSDSKGYLVREWKRIRDHNHFLDCRVYARAASAMLGIDRFSENEWLERESRYGKTEDRAIESNVIERQEVPKQKARVKRKRPSKFFGKQ